ncbi:hypothetical protein ACFL2T_04060, partial [Elusimicrobiota bacterium]
MGDLPKYWLAEEDSITGPHDRESLVRLPGFGPEALICPADTDGSPKGGWREASAVTALSEPPPRPRKSPFLPPSPTVRELGVIGSLQEKSDLIGGALDEIRRDIKAREVEISTLKDDLVMKDRAAALLQSRIDGLEERLRAAEALEGRLDGLREAGRSQMDRIGQLQESMGTVGQQLEEVREELRESRQKLLGMAEEAAQPPPPPNEVPPDVLVHSARRLVRDLPDRYKAALIAVPVLALLAIMIAPSTLVYFMTRRPAEPAPEISSARAESRPAPSGGDESLGDALGLPAQPSRPPRKRRRRKPRPRAGESRRTRAKVRPARKKPVKKKTAPAVSSAASFAKAFPVRAPFHSKCPKDLLAVSDWNKNSWEKPRDIAGQIACRRTIAVAYSVDLVSEL